MAGADRQRLAETARGPVLRARPVPAGQGRLRIRRRTASAADGDGPPGAVPAGRRAGIGGPVTSGAPGAARRRPADIGWPSRRHLGSAREHRLPHDRRPATGSRSGLSTVNRGRSIGRIGRVLPTAVSGESGWPATRRQRGTAPGRRVRCDGRARVPAHTAGSCSAGRAGRVNRGASNGRFCWVNNGGPSSSGSIAGSGSRPPVTRRFGDRHGRSLARSRPAAESSVRGGRGLRPSARIPSGRRHGGPPGS